jgi:hypothetical protein
MRTFTIAPVEDRITGATPLRVRDAPGAEVKLRLLRLTTAWLIIPNAVGCAARLTENMGKSGFSATLPEERVPQGKVLAEILFSSRAEKQPA